MRSLKLLATIAICGGIFASCGTSEQQADSENQINSQAPTSGVTPDTSLVAQYNKDEAEMLDKHEFVTYKSGDGKSIVKISFDEKENGEKYLKFQKDNGSKVELAFVSRNGSEIYASKDGKIQWESKEAGGLGTLTENGKKTEYAITNE